jgi:hypothetical protein
MPVFSLTDTINVKARKNHDNESSDDNFLDGMSQGEVRHRFFTTNFTVWVLIFINNFSVSSVRPARNPRVLSDETRVSHHWCKSFDRKAVVRRSRVAPFHFTCSRVSCIPTFQKIFSLHFVIFFMSVQIYSIPNKAGFKALKLSHSNWNAHLELVREVKLHPKWDGSIMEYR